MAGASAEAVICGAGLAGISAAYHLAVRRGMHDVVLVDDRAPLTLTSDKSTECYRNWWPGPGDAMVSLMNRSIDIMEELARESGNAFHLSRRGYLYVTADPAGLSTFVAAAEATSALGAGALRRHTGGADDPAYQPHAVEGFEDQPNGADLILDRDLIRRHFPYLSESVVAVLHARRCGWLSAQQLGMYVLEQAREAGVRLVRDRLVGVDVEGGSVAGVRLDGAAVGRVSTPVFVDAAGPFAGDVARLLGVDLPVYHELHAKIAINDPAGAIPREAPMLIWTDPQRLPWSAEEREGLSCDPETAPLLGMLPGGAHTRPEGGLDARTVLMLWPYHVPAVAPSYPPPVDPCYAEATLRGLATMLPGLAGYVDRMPRPSVDAGYYTKTRENRPLICPLPVAGAYVIGALSGFGLMACCGAGALLADHVTRSRLPSYAAAFELERYDDPAYLRLLAEWEGAGQL